MKKYIVFAALLLVTGCMANTPAPNRQSAPAPVPARIQTKARPAVHAPIVTQASSVATRGARKLSVKQVPNIDLGGLLGGQMPTENPVQQPQNPVQQPQNPVQQPRNPAQQPQNQEPQASTGFEQKVLQLVNAQRSKAGLSALTMDDNLSKMALVKAQDMINNNYFDHNSPTYGSPFDMMKKFQITYNSAGENIAKGQTSPDQVMNDWMNSEGHKANILGSSYTKIGVGYYNNAWVQEFTG